MKNAWVFVFVILSVVVLMLILFSFQVRETEVALRTTFGKPSPTCYTPGWYAKFPPPIHVIHKFDSRSQLYEGAMEETTTKGSEPIVVSSYVVWKIAEPLKFLESVRDKAGAEDKLKGLLRDAQNSIVGQHYFSEFVNVDPSKIKFAEIEQKMYESLAGLARSNYGIEIQSVGIKQLGVSKEVTKDVFERMKADRQRKKEIILAQGKATAIKIKSDADTKRTQLLTVAEAQAKAIRGSGDAEAAKYYKLLEADPDFAMFLRDVEALKAILKDKSTIVLGADSEPVKLLKGVPDIEPKK